VNFGFDFSRGFGSGAKGCKKIATVISQHVSDKKSAFNAHWSLYPFPDLFLFCSSYIRSELFPCWLIFGASMQMYRSRRLLWEKLILFAGELLFLLFSCQFPSSSSQQGIWHKAAHDGSNLLNRRAAFSPCLHDLALVLLRHHVSFYANISIEKHIISARLTTFPVKNIRMAINAKTNLCGKFPFKKVVFCGVVYILTRWKVRVALNARLRAD
jgi:hypothetical protein